MAAPDLLLSRMKAAGIRPTDLAKALDITKQHASMILSGKRGLAVWHLDAVAELLGVPVADLFRPVFENRASHAESSDGKKSAALTSSVPSAGVDSDSPRGFADAQLASGFIGGDLLVLAQELQQFGLRLAALAGRADRAALDRGQTPTLSTGQTDRVAAARNLRRSTAQLKKKRA